MGFVGGLKVISPTESRTVGVTQRRNKGELIGDLGFIWEFRGKWNRME